MFAASVPDLVFMCLAALLALGASTALTQSDGDLFAHIQLGLRTLADHAAPHVSAFGLTSHGSGMTSPAWLSEIVVAAAWRVGGLALIAIIAAIVIAAAHATVAWTLRHKGADIRWVVAGTIMSVGLGGSHWLARPHMFSLLAAALLIAILEQPSARRTFLAVPLMLLWVNLHGAWVYGLAVMAAYLAGEAFDLWRADRGITHDFTIRVAALAATAAATLANPYGIALHRDVLASLTDPTLSAFIDEYRPPGYHQSGDLLFLAAVGVSIVVFARGKTPMKASRLLVVLATLAAALMAGRNIALFGVTGWTLVALHAAEQWPHPAILAVFTEFSRRESRAVVGSWGAPAAVALLAFGIFGSRVDGRQLIAGRVDANRFPVAAVDRLEHAADGGGERIFTTWEWGGYLVFAWPGQRAFIDPLRFSGSDVQAYGDVVLTRPGWDAQLDRWQVSTVITSPRSRIASALSARPAWRLWYADSTASVYRRVEPQLAGIPRSEATRDLSSR